MLFAYRPRTALAGAVLAMLFPAQGVLGAVPQGFEGFSVASDQELDTMRGGFEINIGGQLLSLAFSLERVSYLNGELLTSTRITVPDIIAAIRMPESVTVSTQIAQPSPSVQPNVSGGAGIQVNQPQVASFSLPSADINNYVTLIQNGAGNSVALPAQASQALQAAQAQVLQAFNHSTVIQNTLDNQVVRNLTTLNIILTNEALARAVQANADLAQLLNAPFVVPQN